MKKSYCLLLMAILLTACSQTASEESAQPTATDAPVSTKQPTNHDTASIPSQPPVQSQAPSPKVAVSPQATPIVGEVPKPDHVVIVVEENHSFEKIIGNKSAPYMNALSQQSAFFSQSYAVTHPSQPNYLILFSGSDQGVKDDSCGHNFKTTNLASELLQANYTFGGYSEDLPSVGSTVCTNHQYGRKHSPWVNFTNVPKEMNMPLDSFPSDFSKLPTVSFVIPNMDNDMHDGTIKTADDWLKSHVDPYVQWAKSHNSLFILTWDEDDSSKKNHIPTLFVGPMVKTGQFDQPITHMNVLRTLEDMYQLPHAGKSGDAQAIKGIWENSR
ncbi:alkaline phosphatase family protein [Paenibacillus sp. SI8]|uniref:alkaline phosphatase family protein n=1 Tax=unclassified Paenibacillus TaxID=185978 RepID=UPI003465E286